MVALGEVAEIERQGVAPATVAPATRYIGLEHIERGGRIIGHESVATAELASTKFRFTADHVLFGKLRPNLGKIARPDTAGICSTDILPIRPGQSLDRDYLFHYLSQPTMIAFAASRAAGANLPRLSPTVLAEFAIPLPPLPEQRRIAAILDHADALQTKRRQVIRHLDDLAQSIFYDMFGRLPREPLGPKLNFVTSGGRGWAKYYADEGEPFIRSLDVRMNDVSLDDLALVEAPDNAEARRTRTQVDDVLLTITGSRIGRAAPLPKNLAGSYISQHVAILRPNTDVVLADFLSAFLCSPTLGQRQIAAAQYGQTKPGLNFAQIRDFRIPPATLDQQLEFRRRLALVRELRSKARLTNTNHHALFSSLQSRAFRGEL